eukprot:c43958_g1_i1 orf=3-155(-)
MKKGRVILIPCPLGTPKTYVMKVFRHLSNLLAYIVTSKMKETNTFINIPSL